MKLFSKSSWNIHQVVCVEKLSDGESGSHSWAHSRFLESPILSAYICPQYKKEKSEFL